MKHPIDDPSHPIRVVFFGDSTCVGQGVSIYRGWVTRIAQSLDEYGQMIGREIVVSNASVNGRTTRQALEDMPYHVQSPGVDILVVQFGLNDCNHWASDRGLARVSLAAFIANLREIVARAERFGAFRVLVNNNHPTSRTDKLMPESEITYEQSNQMYSQATKDMAQNMGGFVSFQDIASHFSQCTDVKNPIHRYLLADGLHLSNDGHAVYYELMYPVIKKAIDSFIDFHSRMNSHHK